MGRGTSRPPGGEALSALSRWGPGAWWLASGEHFPIVGHWFPGRSVSSRVAHVQTPLPGLSPLKGRAWAMKSRGTPGSVGDGGPWTQTQGSCRPGCPSRARAQTPCTILSSPRPEAGFPSPGLLYHLSQPCFSHPNSGGRRQQYLPVHGAAPGLPDSGTLPLPASVSPANKWL